MKTVTCYGYFFSLLIASLFSCAALGAGGCLGPQEDRAGNYHVAPFALELAGAPMHRSDSSQSTFNFFTQIQQDDVERVGKLLQGDATLLKKKSSAGCTPLDHAVTHGARHVMLFLLARDDTPDIPLPADLMREAIRRDEPDKDLVAAEQLAAKQLVMQSSASSSSSSTSVPADRPTSLSLTLVPYCDSTSFLVTWKDADIVASQAVQEARKAALQDAQKAFAAHRLKLKTAMHRWIPWVTADLSLLVGDYYLKKQEQVALLGGSNSSSNNQ